MRQKIKGACWNTTATTAEQSTIFSEGIKMMTFCSGFYLLLLGYYCTAGPPQMVESFKTRSGLKLNLPTQPCILYYCLVSCLPRLVCWTLGTWMTPFPLPVLSDERVEAPLDHQ